MGRTDEKGRTVPDARIAAAHRHVKCFGDRHWIRAMANEALGSNMKERSVESYVHEAFLAGWDECGESLGRGEILDENQQLHAILLEDGFAGDDLRRLVGDMRATIILLQEHVEEHGKNNLTDFEHCLLRETAKKIRQAEK